MIYHINLQKGEVWRPEGLENGAFQIVTGTLWATSSESAEDHILGRGGVLLLAQKNLVIEALEDTTMKFIPDLDLGKKKAPKGFSVLSSDINP